MKYLHFFICGIHKCFDERIKKKTVNRNVRKEFEIIQSLKNTVDQKYEFKKKQISHF